MTPPIFRPSHGDKPFAEAVTKLVRQHSLAVEALTEEQLSEAIRQALVAGDFVRHVLVGSGAQQIVYIPYAEVERLRSLYNELLYAVAQKCEGETRHETALRYIREREHKQSGANEAKMEEKL